MLKALGLSLKPQNAAADASSRFTLIVECLGQEVSQNNNQAQYTEMETNPAEINTGKQFLVCLFKQT